MRFNNNWVEDPKSICSLIKNIFFLYENSNPMYITIYALALTYTHLISGLTHKIRAHDSYRFHTMKNIILKKKYNYNK